MPRYGHLRGQQCPPFRVSDTHGEWLTEANLRGGPSVVVFFPFAFTPICDGELTALEGRIREFDNVGVLAISCDAPAALRAFQETGDFSFEVASDFWPHGQMARAFGVFDEVSGTPQRATFVLDDSGVIRWSVINPPGQARDVEDYLRAIGALRDGMES